MFPDAINAEVFPALLEEPAKFLPVDKSPTSVHAVPFQASLVAANPGAPAKAKANPLSPEALKPGLPSFKSATVGGPPLFGAQQIPGDDPSLRVGEVSFPYKSYARSEIVKASSALTVANQIITKIQEEKIIPVIAQRTNQNLLLNCISKDEIDQLASQLTVERGYPEALSKLIINN